jgi:IS5 family transposase
MTPKQMNLAMQHNAGFEQYRKATRRDVFLAEMEIVVPWSALLALIEPVYPKAGRGRQPYPLQTMLRVHLMQNWFGYSDPAMEEALYEVAPLRRFAGLSLTRGSVPDETTILNFRRLGGVNYLGRSTTTILAGRRRGMIAS